MSDACWYHCTTHTYAAWLPGDGRGFRTRHHREHVEGDYKNPPPAGKYADELARSRRLMTQPAVVLPPEWRPVIGGAVRDRLTGLGAQVIAVACDATHVHLLAKMPPVSVRTWVGLAKKHAWFVARDHGWVGKLWAVRSKATPTRDRRHQVNCFDYILRHAAGGAWVWSFRDGLPPQSPPVATGGL